MERNVVWLRNDKWDRYLDQGQARCLFNQAFVGVTGRLSDCRIRLLKKWGHLHFHLDQVVCSIVKGIPVGVLKNKHDILQSVEWEII